MSPANPRVDVAPEHSHTVGESVKETIESIVVALILAFVFRAFVVEAFVIPTGSMAPTLYGAHGTISCEDCGYEFAYGLRDLGDSRPGLPAVNSSRAICPNCDHPNTRLAITDENRNPEKGDRILVLKWPFDFGGEFLGPKRWEVIVFKDPSDGVTNFIKRLVGMPNEVLMILDGDIYTVPTGELSQETLAALDDQRHEKFLLRAGTSVKNSVPRLPDFALTELDEKLRVRRKIPEAQEVLWWVVYDHDYKPTTLDPGQPVWVAPLRDGSKWNTEHRRITFAGGNEQKDFIELQGKALSASNAYNISGVGILPQTSDHRVKLAWTPESEDAEITMRLTKRGKAFFAHLRGDGSYSLYESTGPTVPPTRTFGSGTSDEISPGKTVALTLSNVDYKLSLEVGDRVVAESNAKEGTPGYYGPDVSALRKESATLIGGRRALLNRTQPPRIYGSGGASTIEHLRVDRDIHYFTDGRQTHLRWAPLFGWASAGSPILLRDGEYFMLGDNTAASKDSRLWDEIGPHVADRGEGIQLGTVPRDQLIGRAVFVYWPSGHRLDWLNFPVLSKFGIVPDVGRMRWIR